MQRVHATAAGLLAWLLLTPVAPAQQGPLDLVPDGAAFGLVVRNLADVRDWDAALSEFFRVLCGGDHLLLLRKFLTDA